jgi:predicted transcriptional regulator
VNKGEWTFLSNHGRVLIYLAKHPNSTTQELAQKASLSIRAVQNIIDDLEHGGYITRNREGRKNHYTINPDLPMRHRLEREFAVKEILLALGYDPDPSGSG